MEISAKELASMARDVDEKHNEAMRTFREETAEFHLEVARQSRRGLIKKAGVGGIALAAAPALFPAATFLQRASAQGLDDVTIAVYAESVELAAVAIYSDPDVGKLASTNPDVLAAATLFAKHHQDHADAFGSLAGSKATHKANPGLVKAFTDTLKPTIKDLNGALELAFVVENQAAATYAFALTALTIEGAYKGTATILPVETEHAAILGMVLGKAPADIFVNGAFEGATVGDLGNAKVGIDPAKFPVA